MAIKPQQANLITFNECKKAEAINFQIVFELWAVFCDLINLPKPGSFEIL